MFGRKNKIEPEQGRAPGRQVDRSGGPGPAFSYYNNRGPEVRRERTQIRTDRVEQPETGKSRRLPRSFSAQLPFWLLVALGVVCVAKVLLLSTSPKVIVVGRSPVSANYLQPTTVYADAAHKLLSSSITSHSKLTVDLDGTARAMEREFPELQMVSMGLPLVGSRPIVYVQVATPTLILQTAHGDFALNKSGVVLAKLHTIPADVPLVVDQSASVPKPGKQYLPSSTVTFVAIQSYQLAAAHLSVSTFVLPAGSPYELDAHLAGQAYALRFNLQEDALTQSGAAIATLQHLEGAIPASYIDVRVPGRVYYK
jgi:hypothetical protein